jgi:DNA-binding NarL/FixJ family response regulator
MPLPRVFLADDHQLLLEAFSKFLEGKCQIVGTARNGAELMEGTNNKIKALHESRQVLVG